MTYSKIKKEKNMEENFTFDRSKKSNIKRNHLNLKKILRVLIKNTKLVVGGVFTLVTKVAGGLLKIIFKVTKDALEFLRVHSEIYFSKPDTGLKKKVTHVLAFVGIVSVLNGGISIKEVFPISNPLSNLSLSASSNARELVLENGDIEYIVGEISHKYDISSTDSGRVKKVEIWKENEQGEKTELQKSYIEYGVGQFTDQQDKRYVVTFIKYLKENHKDFYNKYFADDCGEPGTSKFETTWKKASEAEGLEFRKLQVNYIWENIMSPVAKKLKKSEKIDFTRSIALQETLYSTVNQYGEQGTIAIIKKAELKKKMSDEEIIKAIHNEKKSSLGVYTYTTKSDRYKNSVSNRLDNELNDLLQLVE